MLLSMCLLLLLIFLNVLHSTPLFPFFLLPALFLVVLDCSSSTKKGSLFKFIHYIIDIFGFCTIQYINVELFFTTLR